MNISVDGFRGSSADWEAVRSVPPERLPPLSEGQREVARELGIPEADYARSLLAGQRNQEKLLQKTQSLARVLQRLLRDVNDGARVKSVALRVFQERLDVELEVDGEVLSLRIDEGIVDDYFEKGSAESEQNLVRILERAFGARVR